MAREWTVVTISVESNHIQFVFTLLSFNILRLEPSSIYIQVQALFTLIIPENKMMMLRGLIEWNPSHGSG